MALPERECFPPASPVSITLDLGVRVISSLLGVISLEVAISSEFCGDKLGNGSMTGTALALNGSTGA